MVDKKTKIEDTLKLSEVSKDIVGKINLSLDEFVNGTNTINKSTSDTANLIIESNCITTKIINKVRAGDNDYKPSHINKLSKMFVRDILNISDYNSFDKVKKQGLKKSMKIAVAVILKDMRGQDSKGNRTDKKGSFYIKTSKLSNEQNTKFNPKNYPDIALTVKEVSSLSEDVLNFQHADTSASELKLAFNRAFTKLDDYIIDGVVSELPADCRMNWTSWYNKIGKVLQSFPKADTKIYAQK